MVFYCLTERVSWFTAQKLRGNDSNYEQQFGAEAVNVGRGIRRTLGRVCLRADGRPPYGHRRPLDLMKVLVGIRGHTQPQVIQEERLVEFSWKEALHAVSVER